LSFQSNKFYYFFFSLFRVGWPNHRQGPPSLAKIWAKGVA
jgi:hypothetical protein